ncbi:hypothetical protein [Wolbachia endosymbiont (group A) of Conops quadrifasciatus]|uniref:hypothetical protein n=1 Tax=Wolbachia endosymbiont (group A) of Conops quadrifasciatus TaxID=3066143 RepID=UPI003132F7CE
MSKLTIRVPAGGDDILDARGQPTGLKARDCMRIIHDIKNDLEIVDGRIVGKCHDNP